MFAFSVSIHNLCLKVCIDPVFNREVIVLLLMLPLLSEMTLHTSILAKLSRVTMCSSEFGSCTLYLTHCHHHVLITRLVSISRGYTASIHLSLYLSIHLSIYLLSYLSIHLSTYQSTQPSIRPSCHTPIRISIYPPIHLSIFIYFGSAAIYDGN